MNKVKYVIIGVTSVLLLIISGIYIYQINNKNYAQPKNNQVIKDKKVTINNKTYNVGYEMDMLHDISNKKVLNKLYDYIAIIRIDSIEGSFNKDDITGKRKLTYTKGTAKVLNIFKGNIKEDTINFQRLGGTMKWNEWIKNVVDSDKLISLAKENGHNDLSNYTVNEYAIGDIKLEEGKTYLVFMNKDEYNRYTIQGLQYGTREIKQIYTTKSLKEKIPKENIKNIYVKDNDKNTWITITDVVEFK